MLKSIRNTTALVAAFSLISPAIATAQQALSGPAAELCAPERRPVNSTLANDLGLKLPQKFRQALDEKPTAGPVAMAKGKLNGETTVCLTPKMVQDWGGDIAYLQDELSAAEVTVAGKAKIVPAPVEAAPAEAAPAEAAQGVVPKAKGKAVPKADATPKADAAPKPNLAQNEAPKPNLAQNEAPKPNLVEDEPEMQADGNKTVKPKAAPKPKPAVRPKGVNELPGQASENAVTTPGKPAAAQQDISAVAEQIEQQSAQEADPAVQANLAESEAPKASAAAAADAQASAVLEETVTEDNARSSGEEFSSGFQNQPQAVANGGSGGGNDGMSDLEKALLVGLGAVVVGQALKGDDKATVVSKSDDRVVVLEDGQYRVIRDDNELIERPGSTVKRESFDDGSTRTTVTRENGVQIVTIRDPELRVLRRTRIAPDGTRTVLIDDTVEIEAVDVSALPDPVEQPEVREGDLRAALEAEAGTDRRFALYQVRNIERVRKLAPSIDLSAINFRTGSAVIDPQEARELADLGNLIAAYVEENPGEIFLVEGHTDAVGNAAYNLALSDRRAESVALALTEYFDVPPENLVVQGYGESDLKRRTLEAERVNRRAAVRRITGLLR